MKSIIEHYDRLIDESNDPVYDPPPLKEYMNKWDGQPFIDQLEVTEEKDILEIGVGTGRIAVKVCNQSKSFTGIDLSPKTIARAKLNLSNYSGINLIQGDFLTHPFSESFDIIYSTLTFMHIDEKERAIKRIAPLLKVNGRFVLSISKKKENILTFQDREITLFPDDPDEIIQYLDVAGLHLIKQLETDFAYIFTAVKY